MLEESLNKKVGVLSNEPIGIIGFGGHAREVASYAQQSVTFHAVDAKYAKGDLIDIANPSEAQKNCPVVFAVGAPAVRKELMARWPGQTYANVIAENSLVSDDVKLGTGLQLAPQAVIMPGVRIGDHVVINVAVTVSHDCEIGDFTTISPGVHIGGHVKLGQGVFVGIGATISSGVTLADRCVVGAGAVVLHDVVEENSVLVGVPAKVVKQNTEWLRAI